MAKGKLSRTPEDQLLPFEIIESATQGDPDALAVTLKHFNGYINMLATRSFCDEYGGSYRGIDYELKKRLELKLITRIVQKFKIMY